jgi:hypothetical protein
MMVPAIENASRSQIMLSLLPAKWPMTADTLDAIATEMKIGREEP